MSQAFDNRPDCVRPVVECCGNYQQRCCQSGTTECCGNPIQECCGEPVDERCGGCIPCRGGLLVVGELFAADPWAALSIIAAHSQVEFRDLLDIARPVSTKLQEYETPIIVSDPTSPDD